MGEMLAQEGPEGVEHAVYYLSKKFLPYEEKYDLVEKTYLIMIWATAHQAPQSKGSSRQEYWSGLPCPPPGDLPNPGIEPGSPALAGISFSP